MPQPTFVRATGAGRTVRFGGLAQPNGQGAMPFVNLNDWTSWFLQDFQMDSAQDLVTGAFTWRARSAVLGADFPAAVIQLPMEYREAVAPFGAALARLATAGRQMLSFDTVTGVPCRFRAATSRTAVTVPPLVPRWAFTLEFAAEQQWFQDLAASTYIAALALSSGSATNATVAYSGSVWGEPVYTLIVPNTNVAPIASLRLQNMMSGDDLTVTFPGNLAASTAWTITIDAGALSVTDQLGHAYDVSAGAFPLFYGPAGQVQQIRATLTPASGTATGCTLSAVATNRWML